jgi:hypothetical protein
MTPCPVVLPLGNHRLTVKHPAHLTHAFDLEITVDSPERYGVVLRRYVWLTATSALDDTLDVGAAIRWIRRDGRMIEDFEKDQHTPYSLNLSAYAHEALLTHSDFYDTIITIPADVNELQVLMQPKDERSSRRSVQNEEFDVDEFKWVRFRVKADGQPVPQARIIGRRSDAATEFEFGVTGLEGELLARVPPGRFEFYAIRGREKTGIRTTKITPGRRIKSITLRF